MTLGRPVTGMARFTRRRLAAGLAATAAAAHSASAAVPLRSFDGMSFLPQTPADVERAGLAGFICDVSERATVRGADGAVTQVRTFEACDRSLDAAIVRIRARFPHAYVVQDGRSVASDPRCGIVLQFQSCEAIGSDLSRLAYFHSKGLRILQITHNYNNAFGGACFEPVQSGLTPLGRQAVAEMRRTQ